MPGSAQPPGDLTHDRQHSRRQYHAGLFGSTPWLAGARRQVIQNPLKAQRLAEQLNSKKVAA